MRLATDLTESKGLKPNAPMLPPSKGRVSVLNLLINLKVPLGWLLNLRRGG